MLNKCRGKKKQKREIYRNISCSSHIFCGTALAERQTPFKKHNLKDFHCQVPYHHLLLRESLLKSITFIQIRNKKQRVTWISSSVKLT